MNSKCVFVRNLELFFRPVRFAVIGEENIAVTTGNQVNSVDLKRGLIVKILIKGTKAGSIVLTHDKNLMVEIFGGGYTMIDLNGNVIKRINIGFSEKKYHPRSVLMIDYITWMFQMRYFAVAILTEIKYGNMKISFSNYIRLSHRTNLTCFFVVAGIQIMSLSCQQMENRPKKLLNQTCTLIRQ